MVELNYVNLPESFFEEETRLDYKISKQIKEVWAIQLDMLQLVKNICEKNQIQWFICGGSALGAVRDGHMIPWDDDIDIHMTRENYNKFLAAWEAENVPEPYYCQTKDTDENCMHNFTKIHRLDTLMTSKNNTIYPEKYSGIYIDIFPLDKLPNDTEERTKFINQIKSLNYDPEKHDELIQLLTKYNDDETLVNYMETGLIARTTTHMIYKVADFTDSVEMDLECVKIPVMSGYKSYFVDKYGEDWETPKQVPSNHTEQVYDTDNSYLAYDGVKYANKKFMNLDEYNMMKQINSKINTGKDYIQTPENETIFPAVYDYDMLCTWLYTLPEDNKRFISLNYIGDDEFNYTIKDYAGETIIASGDIKGLDTVKTAAIKDAFRTIILPRDVFVTDPVDPTADSDDTEFGDNDTHEVEE